MTDKDNSKQEPATAQAKQGDPVVTEKSKADAPNRQTESAADGVASKTTKNTSPKDTKDSGKSSKEKPAQPAGKKTTQPKRPLPITAAIALVLGFVVAGASYMNYTRWQMSDLQTQSLANENVNMRAQLGELQQELQKQITAMQRQDLDLNLAAEQLRDDVKLQNDSITQLSQQFQALAADKGKDPMLWRVAEVEFLLSVANHQLMLQRDVDTAQVALQDADRRLESIGDPALIPMRKLIASEITALKSVEVPDTTGMALRLSSLVDNIERLPLVNRERRGTDVAGDSELVGSMDELMTRIVKDLKGVVSIRRSDKPIEPLLPPEEQHYLAQNLGLKLEESRIALLRGDTAAFRQNLADTREWVQRYFDQDSAAVGNVISTMDDLQAVELRPPLPDISGSLRELRRWLAAQQQNNAAQSNFAPQTGATQHEGKS